MIKNMSRLLSSQLSNHDGAVVFCRSCLSHFPNKEKLLIHEEYCLNNEATWLKMPEGECPEIYFIHHNRFIKVPFVVYADFETFTEEISTCEPNDKKVLQNNIKNINRVDFVIKLSVLMKDTIKNQVHYRAKDENEDIGQKFVEMLEEDVKRIHKEFEFSKKMIPLTKEERCEFEKATVCWIC